MVINMASGYTEAQLQHVIDRVKECGFQPHVTRGTERAIVAAVGSGGSRTALEALQAAPGVETVVPIAHPFKLVSRQTRVSAPVSAWATSVLAVTKPWSLPGRVQ